MLLPIWSIAITAAAQTNTTISARLDDLKEGTVVYISPMVFSAKRDLLFWECRSISRVNSRYG
jgi:hypothetical protein